MNICRYTGLRLPEFRVCHPGSCACLRCATAIGPFVAFLCSVGLLGLLSGCATHIKVTKLASKPPTTKASGVKVIRLGEAPPANYEVLGVVSAVSKWKPVNRGTIKHLQTQAAAIGADSLLGYYEELRTIPTGYNSWSSALVVRTLPPTERPTATNFPFIVAIPRIVIATNVPTKDKAQLIERWAHSTAQLLLTERGYYAFTTDEVPPASLEDGLRTLGETSEGNLDFPKPDLLLGIHLRERRRGVGVGIQGMEGVGPRERNTLQVALFSRLTGQAIYDNLGSGAFSEGYLIYLFLPSMKTAESVQRAIIKALQPLPQFSPAQP